MDFNVTHFANFKFAYFEIEESFGLIWVKIQNDRFHLQISVLGTCNRMIRMNVQNDPLELKIAIFVLVSQIIVFHFVYKKDFWHILVKFMAYKVSLSSNRSNKNISSV